MAKLTHLDEKGKARMVDVTAKEPTVREAVASGRVVMNPETVRAVDSGKVKKGDVLSTARLAGIMAAKRTSEIIPLCHPLELTDIDVRLKTDIEKNEVIIEAVAKTVGRTGVEMEALTAVSAAALTVYDMCKAADRQMAITDIKLMKKKGGRSGTFVRQE